jgi:hypothetical protein
MRKAKSYQNVTKRFFRPEVIACLECGTRLRRYASALVSNHYPAGWGRTRNATLAIAAPTLHVQHRSAAIAVPPPMHWRFPASPLAWIS